MSGPNALTDPSTASRSSVTEPGHPFYECFWCGPGHPDELRVRCFKDAEGVVGADRDSRALRGARRARPKAIVATYLDDVLGAAVERTTGRAAVTGERPRAPRERPRRYVDVEGGLEVLETRRTVATARGRFFPLND